MSRTKSAATTVKNAAPEALPDPTADAPLLEVKDLAVSFPSEDGRVNAVRGVSISVARTGGRVRFGQVGHLDRGHGSAR